MAELWEWEEAYILFQTAVMDEGTAEEKKRRRRTGGSLRASTISNSHARFASIETGSQ